MLTFEEQKAFFEGHWPNMKTAAEEEGAAGVVRFIEGFVDSRERRTLYFFARQGLAQRDWRNKSFDAYIDVCRSGIREFLEEANAAGSEEIRKTRVNGANIISYNLAADLADCWPGDQAPRTRTHFEAGLEASTNCIRWREELGNGPTALSMAYWAKGMHELSLGEPASAAESWKQSLANAVKAAEADGKSGRVAPDGEFGVILGTGFLGLAEWADGDETGRTRFEEARAAFDAQTQDETLRDDAQFGLDQLETVRSRYLG